MELMDTGSQISALTKGLCSEFGLRILPFGGLLHLKGTEGIVIPFKGYIEAKLTVPGLPQYNEDMLFLVAPDHKYGEGVPVSIGTQVIDHLAMTMT